MGAEKSDTRVMSKKPKPGQVVAIALEGGGYALGWLTHVGSDRRPFIIGRFYACRFGESPSVDEAHEYVVSNIPDIVGRVGDRGLRTGGWTPIGEPLVPPSGFKLLSLLEYTNVGSPAVAVLDEETYDTKYTVPATPEDLKRETGIAGIMGDVYVSQRLERLYLKKLTGQGL